ncbi:MAG: hypothetical protein A2Z34_10225 [Planctomycetes bacterium RBG_16_59_8]|nr:MAG: hypothetical protein A2Z34_10225 [Planctomycetes bacterium RBG_16_59_8]
MTIVPNHAERVAFAGEGIVATYVLREQTGSGHFNIRYEQELNPVQLEVVTSGDGPSLVIAGAGSGKTRVLTYRVARLVESGVDPSSILLVTFTNKASREMMRRVELLLRADIRRMWGGTFHHIGNLILRRHADRLGYGKNFSIIDRDDAKSLMDDCSGRLKKERNLRRFPKADVLLDVYSYCVNTVESPDRVIEKRYPWLMEFQDEAIMLFKRYDVRKKELNSMDFDDLLENWRRLLDDPALREFYSRAFTHILVDEYQDTNRLQSTVIETIAGAEGNLMVVGDDSQSIYSFRGASFENIIDFPKRFPTCRVFKLEDNYRSIPQILDLANNSIRNNRRQHEKQLRAARKGGAVPEVVVCGSPVEQAKFIAQRVGDLREEGRSLKEIAVLYRAHYHSMELQMELTRRGIPFEVRSGIRFFEQAHIKDVAAYLRIVANPKDEVAWKRVLQLYPSVGKATAEKIWNAIRQSADPLAAVRGDTIGRLLSANGRKGWERLKGIVDALALPEKEQSPAHMIEEVLEGGYEEYLVLNFPNATGRTEDIRQLANYALGFNSLTTFLADLSLLSNVFGENAAESEVGKENLILSTIHQAKGLEWEVVFMLWLVDGRFPDARAMREESGEEEERRLFYVAATRAKDRLTLTSPAVAREGAFMEVLQRPSRFLQELDAKLYEESAVSAEEVEGDGGVPFPNDD